MSKHGNASPNLGLFAEFAGAVVAGLPRDLDPAVMQQWVEPAGRPALRARLQRAFADLAPLARLVKIIKVTCHGNATATQLIAQANYTWVNPSITDERFPIQPHAPATYELELFQFDHDPTWEEVLAERTRRNLDEPIPEQGFFLGIQHPDEQHQHPIVITHDPVLDPYGSPDVLVLYGDAAHRRLDLLYARLRWYRVFVFTGVRKLAS